jgi:uncharacterized membrane protein YgcG
VSVAKLPKKQPVVMRTPPASPANVYTPAHDAGADGCSHSVGQLVELSADVQPGAHAVQAVAPATAEKVRSAQAAHVAALLCPVALDAVPGSQSTTCTPTMLDVPSKPPPGQNLPAGQVSCVVRLPTPSAGMYQPARMAGGGGGLGGGGGGGLGLGGGGLGGGGGGGLGGGLGGGG